MINGNLFLGTDYADYMDSLKGLPSHPERSRGVSQYNMRCLDKLDMTDTIRLRKSV